VLAGSRPQGSFFSGSAILNPTDGWYLTVNAVVHATA